MNINVLGSQDFENMAMFRKKKKLTLFAKHHPFFTCGEFSHKVWGGVTIQTSKVFTKKKDSHETKDVLSSSLNAIHN